MNHLWIMLSWSEVRKVWPSLWVHGCSHFWRWGWCWSCQVDQNVYPDLTLSKEFSHSCKAYVYFMVGGHWKPIGSAFGVCLLRGATVGLVWLRKSLLLVVLAVGVAGRCLQGMSSPPCWAGGCCTTGRRRTLTLRTRRRCTCWPQLFPPKSSRPLHRWKAFTLRSVQLALPIKKLDLSVCVCVCR